jgi:hypothetical protein
MTFESVTLRPDGAVEFSFGDDDTFLGHWIVVNGTFGGGPELRDNSTTHRRPLITSSKLVIPLTLVI